MPLLVKLPTEAQYNKIPKGWLILNNILSKFEGLKPLIKESISSLHPCGAESLDWLKCAEVNLHAQFDFIWPLLLYFRLFLFAIDRLGYSKYFIADVGIHTTDLWCWRQPLCQLRHNHGHNQMQFVFTVSVELWCSINNKCEFLSNEHDDIGYSAAVEHKRVWVLGFSFFFFAFPTVS